MLKKVSTFEKNGNPLRWSWVMTKFVSQTIFLFFFFTLGFWIWKKFYLLRISIIFLVELGIAINYYCKLQLRYIEQNIISLMHNRKQNNNEIHFFLLFLKTNTKVKRAAGCNLESITTDFFFLQKVVTKTRWLVNSPVPNKANDCDLLLYNITYENM